MSVESGKVIFYCSVLVLQFVFLSIVGGVSMFFTSTAVVIAAVVAIIIGLEIGHKDAKRIKKKILEAKKLRDLKREIELEDE